MTVRAGFALREVRQAFVHTVEQMRRMNANCDVKPTDPNVIQPAGPDLQLECSPVVCRVPERASHSTASLFVVFAGAVAFDPEADRRLITTMYRTNFAYFSLEEDGAKHVLGGHYDFSPAQPAHPSAHIQLRSQTDLYMQAQSQFHSLDGVPLTDDLMQGVLTRVRPPSAQMDFLSFLVQVSADHLVDGRSPASAVSVFERLSSSCDPVLGYRALTDGCDCHRAPHWYRSN